MNFVELKIECNPELGEILIAELSLFSFDAFEEIETGILASCEEQQWDEEAIIGLLKHYDVDFVWTFVPKANWNQEWEKNYPPVKIDDQIYIRAHFHPEESFPYQILITPKMSFGTGHHQTTSLMLKAQLSYDHNQKKVLDVGCGTGVLAIMAFLLGAQEIQAIDIDEWSVGNSRENFALNGCTEIGLTQGDISIIPKKALIDIVLANINRNVLMEQLGGYKDRMKLNALLLISGFYVDDIPLLEEKAKSVGFGILESRSQNNWAMMVLKKE